MRVNKCVQMPLWSVRIHCFSAALKLFANTSANRLEFCGNTVISIKKEGKLN